MRDMCSGCFPHTSVIRVPIAATARTGVLVSHIALRLTPVPSYGRTCLGAVVHRTLNLRPLSGLGNLQGILESG
jgi:hypothetical protein